MTDRLFRLSLLLGVCGFAGCARGLPVQQTAPTPAPEAAPAAAAAAAAAPVAEERAAPPAPASPADVRPSPRAATKYAADTTDDAFLDSLHALAADSAAPVRVRVDTGEVRSEAVRMFGRPGGAAAGPTWDIDVASYASHDRVQYWMDFFTGRARWHFERYIERSGRYDSMIRTRLAAAGLPQDLIYLAMIESGFNQVARSRSGAVGLWQFIPGTARRYGLTVDAWVDDRRDPYQSTDAAIRFLAELNDRFGSLYLAAAAYNSGPGKIQRGLRRHDYGGVDGDQAYFLMAEGTFLRRETRDYVPKLIAAALLAKEPERYGFGGLTRWEPLRYDSVRVEFAVGLDVVARLAGTSRDRIEEMNARFLRGVTPPDRRVWVRVPEGTADSVASRLTRLPERERVTFLTHTVTRGETLSSIARRYRVTVSDLKSANRLRSNLLRVRQTLIIPVSLARGQAAGSRSGAAAASRTAAPRGTSSEARSRRVHIVRRGETLSGIAEDFRVPLSSLLRANNLTSRSTIRPGQAIRIPN
jgi:membrane-bound lytic murein transglycosylase D